MLPAARANSAPWVATGLGIYAKRIGPLPTCAVLSSVSATFDNQEPDITSVVTSMTNFHSLGDVARRIGIVLGLFGTTRLLAELMQFALETCQMGYCAEATK